MRNARLLALAVLAASACSKGPGSTGARFARPSSIAPFAGVTRKGPGLRAYLAVASTRGDEIIIVDPSDDAVVLGPGAVFALGVPTEPRPLRVAAASLGDRDTGGADVLVVASAGSLDLQVIETWTPTNRVVPSASVSLAALLGADAELLAITGLTPPGAGPGAARARILAAATGGRLVVVDFTRDPATGAVVPQQPRLQTLGFDAVDMALDPSSTRVVMASPDPVGSTGGAPVYGVAAIDAGGDPASPWAVTPLDALAPTTAVAVGWIFERLVDPTSATAQDTFQAVAQLRVYAALDPSACGIDRPIDCGVATLDEHGLVADPSGDLPYRSPMRVPGVVTGIAIGYPPASGNSRITNYPYNPGLPLMAAVTVLRTWYTTAVAAVTTTQGFTYLLDLGRYAPMNEVATLTSTSRVGVTTAGSGLPGDVNDPTSANYEKTLQLGLFSGYPPGVYVAPHTVLADAYAITALTQVTPGYTPVDAWRNTWQGPLPELSSRPAVVGRTAAGETYVAVQAAAPGSSSATGWSGVAHVASPDLGIHGGDILELTLQDPTACPAPADPARPYPEPTVATALPFLPPDAALFPGGALRVAPGSCLDAGLAPGRTTTALVTVRAAGLVLTSSQLGYLGRPQLGQPFVLQHRPEAGLSGEELVIARKLRRLFYPLDPPCTTGGPSSLGYPDNAGCYPGYPWLADPLAPGPVLAFQTGVYDARLGAGATQLDPTDPAVQARIARGAAIIFNTISGLVPSYRRPTYGGALPQGVIPYDKTGFVGHENEVSRFYAVYQDDQLIDFSPSLLGTSVGALR